MKKILLPVLMLALLAACEKETVAPVQDATAADIDFRDDDDDDDCPAEEKVAILHFPNSNPPHVIEVCPDAVDAHVRNHGDQVVNEGDVVTSEDKDGDGFSNTYLNGVDQGGEDCDDSNPAINPGAVDICDNGIDEDCDGADASCADLGIKTSGNSQVYQLSGGRTYTFQEAVAACDALERGGYDDWSLPSSGELGTFLTNGVLPQQKPFIGSDQKYAVIASGGQLIIDDGASEDWFCACSRTK